MRTVQANTVPDRRTRTKMAAIAGVDERTIHRYYTGATKPFPHTEQSILDAARSLGVLPTKTPGEAAFARFHAGTAHRWEDADGVSQARWEAAAKAAREAK